MHGLQRKLRALLRMRQRTGADPGGDRPAGRIGQIPFLPVARKLGDLTPIYLENGDQEENSLLLQVLEKKGLISLDFDKPLTGFDQSAYASYPIVGSMALTKRGLDVLELLERQGFHEE